MGFAAAANAAQKIEVVPLSPALGAEIRGVDLRAPLDEETIRTIRKAWNDHIVIRLRGQELSEEDQVRFGETFGPLNRSAKKRAHHNAKNPAIMLISNIRENGQLIGALPDGEMHFHTDQSHQETPCSGTMLYALEVPGRGGDTLFANCYTAYETLSNEMKQRLEGKRALHAYDYDNASTRRGTVLKEGVPHAVHPVVRTHPETGRKALYVNRLMTLRIEDMDPQESEEILQTLFDHIEQPAFVWGQQWKAGDVVLWDNRCSVHARTDFSAAERRLMRRVTILGEKPF
ncbi:MAG TPA: TauD/TfdA family dioxygenase [Xanthobacteraceae bacterium]|jgi:taurine dioxygenase